MLTVLGHAQGLDLKGPGGWVSKGRNGEQAGGGAASAGPHRHTEASGFYPERHGLSPVL